MNLTLFDLDHTLVPFDTGMRWLQFMIEQKQASPEDFDAYLQRCRQVAAGTLSVQALHEMALGRFRHLSRPTLAHWRERFATTLEAEIAPAAKALVQQHVANHDICCIVTATARFLAEPLQRALGVAELVATESVEITTAGESYFTGEVAGEACVGRHKIEHVGAWLTRRELRWEDFAETRFYSDSASDLPLLRHVSHPVAVRPDEVLRDTAERAGWPIIRLS